ncbi:uncharacterized protein LOC119943921 [Tachyglossus aculeatus]|uniref:uncharacterized protein LOC119943921 n=1 Tax=Tachyglossus aculeatus TaxID=9261 RepID=UPI0018F2CA63|nr:uncharacterized protein LOC119943921 [Tachyglossus aculeatus]
MEFLYLLGNSDDLKENSQKDQKTKKSKKVHVVDALKQTAPEMCEEKDLLKPCLEYQGLLKNVSNISSPVARRKNKKLKNKHRGDGSGAPEPTHSTKCSGENLVFSRSSVSEIGKRTKKDKDRRKVRPGQPSDAASRSVGRSPQTPRKSPWDHPRPKGSRVGRLPSPEFGEGDAGHGLSPSGAGGSSQTPYQHGDFESTLDQLAGGTLTGFKKPRKSHKEASVCGVSGIPSPETDSCPSGTDLLLSSTPTGPEFHDDGSGDELSVRGPKAKRPSRRRKSRTEETPRHPDLSQEVFETQESFIPGPVPRSLGLSEHFPSPPSSRASCGRQCDRSVPSRDISQASPDGEEAQELERLFLNHFKTRKKKKSQVATQEKASQTENFFSSPALSTFLLFRQRKEEPEEKPLDLRVPGRRGSPGPTETAGLLEDEPSGSEILLAGEGRRETRRHARPRRSGEKRYVQTLLNSSFYFKVKGEPGTNISKEPLVKSKAKIKAKSSYK